MTLQPRGPSTGHQRGVGLASLAGTELLLKCGQRAALLGDEQQAGGLAVEAVHQFQEPGLRPRTPQLLDHAEAHAAAAVNRHAGRLVDHQQVLVLEHDRELTRRRRRLVAARPPHRRQTQLVADRQPRVGRRPAAVHAHLAAADDPVDVGLGHALERLDEVVVQPLAGAVLGDPRYCTATATDMAAWGLPAVSSGEAAVNARAATRIARRLARRGCFDSYNPLHHVPAVSD